MNQPDTKELNLRQEIVDDTAQLESALDRVHQFERNTQSELANLKSELPDVLLGCVMGGGGEDRKLQIRNRIRELEADLQDYPVLYEQFEIGRGKILTKKTRLRQLEKHRQSYEELKERMEQDKREVGIGTIETLRGYAKSLACEQDAETFLAGLQQEGAA